MSREVGDETTLKLSGIPSFARQPTLLLDRAVDKKNFSFSYRLTSFVGPVPRINQTNDTLWSLRVVQHHEKTNDDSVLNVEQPQEIGAGW